jgi:zinc and cadmium transporter
LAIGAAFLVDPLVGIVATVAIAAHEIPQELGDFALLLQKGMAKKNVLWVNCLSTLATVAAALGVYLLGSSIALPLGALLAITAGFFIYIAVSDIIPTIHAQASTKVANVQTLVLLFGVVFVALVTNYAHQFTHPAEPHIHSVDDEHDHENEHEHEHEH